jgi:lysophospholipase L1-like esterase
LPTAGPISQPSSDNAGEADRLVLVSTIFPVGTPPLTRRPVWSPDIAAGVEEVNTFLRGLPSTKVVVLDAYSALAGTDGLIQQEYSKETLHLNAAGYRVLNREVTRRLREHGGTHGKELPRIER